MNDENINKSPIYKAVMYNVEVINFSLEILKKIKKENWRILDVGGGDQPLQIATHIIDIQKFTENNRNGKIGNKNDLQKYNEKTWINQDICEYPWSFPDKYFDFVWCTQVLEDIRDPISVCKEMSRVGKQGFINTPSKLCELFSHNNNGIFTEGFNGYWHHRWLITLEKNKLIFKHKNALATVINWCDEDIIKILNNNLELGNINLFWTNKIEAEEKIELDDKESFLEIKEYIENLKKKYLEETK
jgi:ubiquinone/menaquinone biosynthesis C-methylase UbiE